MCNDFMRSGYSNFIVDPSVRQVLPVLCTGSASTAAVRLSQSAVAQQLCSVCELCRDGNWTELARHEKVASAARLSQGSHCPAFL